MDSSRKKLIIFSGGYLPAKKYGGPVSSLYNFVELMGDAWDIFVVCRDHDLGETTRFGGISDGWNAVGRARVRYLRKNEYRTRVFRDIIKETGADALFVSSLFSYGINLRAIAAARRLRVPVVLSPRGELDANALAIGERKKKAYLAFLRVFSVLRGVGIHATSEHELECVKKQLNTKREMTFMLPNVPARPEKKASLDKKRGEVRICTVSRIVKNKNTLYSIELAAKVSSAKVTLDIYGPEEDEGYSALCRQAAARAPKNVDICFMGAMPPEAVRRVYFDHDIFILPTEFENYGQSIAEALLHDCPVLISRGTTPWDDVSEAGAGWTERIGDDEAFVRAIETVAEMDGEEYSALVQRLRGYIERKIDFEGMKAGYSKMFETMISINAGKGGGDR